MQEGRAEQSEPMVWEVVEYEDVIYTVTLDGEGTARVS